MLKKIMKNLSFLAGFFLLTGSFSWADEPMKVGVIDMKRCIEQSETGKKAYTLLKERADRIQKEIDSRRDELKKLQEELIRKIPLLSVETKKEKEKELARKEEDFRDQAREKEEELQREQNNALQTISRDLFELAGKVGKEEGYALILEARTSVLYFNNAIDITDKVIKIFNEKEKKQ